MLVANPTEIAPAKINKPILQQGTQGEDVIELQRLLRRWEVYANAVDGVFGNCVYEAVCAWQHRVFLPETGVVDHLTWRSLYTGGPVNMPMLRIGSYGRDVIVLQIMLQKAGINWHQISGEFDALTEEALRSFQRRCGLVIDGMAGYYTWRALSKLPH